MNKIISKLGIDRICAISFTLFCSMLTIETVFSQKTWNKENLKVQYNQKDKYTTFCFLIFDYNTMFRNVHSYLVYCDLYYCQKDKADQYLMTVRTQNQNGEKNLTALTLLTIKRGEKIQLLNSVIPTCGSVWNDADRELKVSVNVLEKSQKGGTKIPAKRSYIEFKWDSDHSPDVITHIKIEGAWSISNKSKARTFKEYYPLYNVIMKSNIIKTDLSVTESKLCDNESVTKDSDVITVTGAEAGENIKVFNTFSGEEVKSAVGNNDVVNIKLPENQIYFLKIGH